MIAKFFSFDLVQLEDLNTKWSKLQKVTTEQASAFEKAHEVQMFRGDVDETKDCIGEKDEALVTSDALEDADEQMEHTGISEEQAGTSADFQSQAAQRQASPLALQKVSSGEKDQALNNEDLGKDLEQDLAPPVQPMLGPIQKVQTLELS